MNRNLVSVSNNVGCAIVRYTNVAVVHAQLNVHIYATNLVIVAPQHGNTILLEGFSSTFSLSFLFNIFHRENFLVALAAIVVISSTATAAHRAKKYSRRFWVPSILQARKEYSTTDFMKDLISDDGDLLSLKHRSEAGSKNFFRMFSSTTSIHSSCIKIRRKRVNLHPH